MNDYISRRFLDALYARLQHGECPAMGGHPFLRVFVPEQTTGKDFDLWKAIVTYSPKHEEIVIHFGVETLQIDLKDWLELQFDAEGKLLYVKDTVAYQFVSKGV